MKLTEEQIKQIIREETFQYLEEIKGSLGAEKFQQFLQQMAAAGKGAYEKGYVPFTEPHRAADRVERAKSSEWEVYIMVMGDPQGRETPLQDWPEDPHEREAVKQFLSLRGKPVDSPWYTVQQLAIEEMKKFRQRQQMAEIIKKEVIKFLKENE